MEKPMEEVDLTIRMFMGQAAFTAHVCPDEKLKALYRQVRSQVLAGQSREGNDGLSLIGTWNYASSQVVITLRDLGRSLHYWEPLQDGGQLSGLLHRAGEGEEDEEGGGFSGHVAAGGSAEGAAAAAGPGVRVRVRRQGSKLLISKFSDADRAQKEYYAQRVPQDIVLLAGSHVLDGWVTPRELDFASGQGLTCIMLDKPIARELKRIARHSRILAPSSETIATLPLAACAEDALGSGLEEIATPVLSAGRAGGGCLRFNVRRGALLCECEEPWELFRKHAGPTPLRESSAGVEETIEVCPTVSGGMWGVRGRPGRPVSRRLLRPPAFRGGDLFGESSPHVCRRRSGGDLLRESSPHFRRRRSEGDLFSESGPHVCGIRSAPGDI